MRGCADVDRRHHRLFHRRGSLHPALTLAPSIGPTAARARDCGIRFPTHCDTTHPSAQGGDSLMSQRSALAEFSSAAEQERHCGRSTLLSDYWALTKPEVNFLILVTTFVGFYLASASDGRLSFAGLCNTLLGTLLVASGTGTLNQYLERKFDAQMRRTARRPA